MALIKYSIGPITSVKDKDSVEERESPTTATDKVIMALCKKCGLQHMVAQSETRVCCGKSIETDKLS